MSSPEEKLNELGITLTGAPKPLGSYVPALKVGNLLFLSGMLPLKDGKLWRTGIVGAEVSADDARACARLCAINALSVAKEYTGGAGGLDRIARCVKITGYVASTAGFTGQPGVLNGASDLMVEVFGDAGRHVRSAVGVAVLPLNSPVEIEFVFELL